MLPQFVAGSGKRLSLELSGRSATVVFAKAHFESVVEGVVDGSCGYKGQVGAMSDECFTEIAVSGWCRLLVDVYELAGKLSQKLECCLLQCRVTALFLEMYSLLLQLNTSVYRLPV